MRLSQLITLLLSFTLRRAQIAKGKGLWIFNSSLALNKEFVEKMNEHISTCLNLLEKENIPDDQVRWEYLKYEVRKFSFKFSKVQAKKLRLERVLLEKKLKNLESDMNIHEEYNDCKTQLEQIYKVKANGIKIRSKCEFWNEVKVPLLLATEKAYLVKQLSASQKQAVIKLIEKKGRGKRYIQNWQPISLLNVDVKLISKALAERLKNVLPEIIPPNQNAYVKNRCISEGGRLISDLLEMSEVLNKEGF